MRSLPRGPSNSITHSAAAVGGGANSTKVAGAGPRRRRTGLPPAAPSVNCLYSNRSTWAVWHTPCDRASSARLPPTAAPESPISPAASDANLQNVRSALADQLVRQGLVVASSVLRRKTDLISSPRATSCKLAGPHMSGRTGRRRLTDLLRSAPPTPRSCLPLPGTDCVFEFMNRGGRRLSERDSFGPAVRQAID